MLAQIQPAAIALQETAHSLRHYLGKLEADPGRLDEVENRLAALEKLKRKYGASVEQVLAFLEEVRTSWPRSKPRTTGGTPYRKKSPPWRAPTKPPPGNSRLAAKKPRPNSASVSSRNWRRWRWKRPASESAS